MTWAEQWVNVFRTVMNDGKVRESREGKTREIVCWTGRFEDPHFQVVAGRGGSERFALIEQLCYLAGDDSRVLAKNFPGFLKYQEPSGAWHGAYGPRLRFTLHYTVEELSRHQNSRRGVSLIYRPEDTMFAARRARRDIPCTICLNFWVDEEDALNCHVFMRSTDVWKGLYYDVPAFHAVQTMVASALGLLEGPLWLTTTSLHVYEEQWMRYPLLEATKPMDWPEGLFYSDQDEPLLRLRDLQENAWSILQSFYNSGAPLSGGRATISSSTAADDKGSGL